MSDEYHQSGSGGSLVDPCKSSIFIKLAELLIRIIAIMEASNSDFETGNYPPQTGDCMPMYLFQRLIQLTASY